MSGTEDLNEVKVRELKKEKERIFSEISHALQELYDAGIINYSQKVTIRDNPEKLDEIDTIDDATKDDIKDKFEQIKTIDEAIAYKKPSRKVRRVVNKRYLKKHEDYTVDEDMETGKKFIPEAKMQLIGWGVATLAVSLAAIGVITWASHRNPNKNKIDIQGNPDDPYRTEQSADPIATPTPEPTSTPSQTPEPTPTVTYDPSSNEIVTPYDYGNGDSGNDDEYEYLYTPSGVVRIKKSDKEKLGQVPTYVPSSTDSTPTPSTIDNSKSDYSDNGYDNAENSDAGYGEASYEEMYEYYRYQIELNEDIINGRRVDYYEDVICNVDYNGRDYDIGERVDKVRKDAMNNQYDNAYNQKTIDDILVILKCGEYKNQTERLQLATAGILATGIGSKFTNNTYPNETRYFISESQAALEILKAYSPGRTMGY